MYIPTEEAIEMAVIERKKTDKINMKSFTKFGKKNKEAK
jgi:hypothetical protein